MSEEGSSGLSEGAPEGEAEPTLQAVTEPEQEFAEIEVDPPLVGIVMGSKSDLPAMESAQQELNNRGIRCEVRAMSAHHEHDKDPAYARHGQLPWMRQLAAAHG